MLVAGPAPDLQLSDRGRILFHSMFSSALGSDDVSPSPLAYVTSDGVHKRTVKLKTLSLLKRSKKLKEKVN